MKKWILLTSILLSSLGLKAQYHQVEQVVETASECEEIRPILSDDGKVLYFLRNLCNQSTQQNIWYTEVKNGKWTDPFKADNLNNDYNNSIVGASRDGKLYLVNQYAGANKMGIDKGIVRASYDKDEYRWLFEEDIVEFKKAFGIKGKLGYSDYYVSLDGNTLIMTADLEGAGHEDLYISYRENRYLAWSSLEKMSDEINSKANEFSPFLSRDGKSLFFSSDREGLGSADIYVTELDEDGNWGTATMLPEPINSVFFDAYYFENDHGIFFSSNRNGELADIYRTARIVEKDTLVENTIIDEEEEVKVVAPKEFVVYFDMNASSVENAQVEKIKNFISTYVEVLPKKVRIYGFADPVGSDKYNARLSKKRAKSVAKYLEKQSFEILEVEGKGVLNEDNARKVVISFE
ncbi:OmpA family protein [Aureibacter tunicatorum]|uniref:Outer membrane protein OmpA-like peptidoglycan-associated protein n=1 Tax=Aureibacter tunicatorum TaxID=866807 RepID=A0AAE4BT46_9BACT|nr:OmpA family protein [Aureibacter tunicatorum]MDR6241839.1 outer membrane protein OmpA-like peptidoglycan-associated protein [Aureibacter tunicatorum]BDD07086.1 hypothetical protein AUTU_45690 [Aureibacter tunicatorum]